MQLLFILTATVGSGDPVPFAPAEGRLADWLGLTVYLVLIVVLCIVSVRMARAPGSTRPPDAT
jgi:hypothetical protein